MSVIPLPRMQSQSAPAAAPATIAFTIGARVDLRLGAVAAGVVRARGPVEDAFSFSGFARLLRNARMAWRERGAVGVLAVHVPEEITATLDPDLITDAALEAGATRRALNFELHERALVSLRSDLAEALRERGWGVVLRGDPDCPIPFGTRARTLYSELVIEAPAELDPFFGVEEDKSLLARRLRAAKAAELIVTAETVRSPAQARQLAVIGFDRGGGPFAEAVLR